MLTRSNQQRAPEELTLIEGLERVVGYLDSPDAEGSNYAYRQLSSFCVGIRTCAAPGLDAENEEWISRVQLVRGTNPDTARAGIVFHLPVGAQLKGQRSDFYPPGFIHDYFGVHVSYPTRNGRSEQILSNQIDISPGTTIGEIDSQLEKWKPQPALSWLSPPEMLGFTIGNVVDAVAAAN